MQNAKKWMEKFACVSHSEKLANTTPLPQGRQAGLLLITDLFCSCSKRDVGGGAKDERRSEWGELEVE